MVRDELLLPKLDVHKIECKDGRGFVINEIETSDINRLCPTSSLNAHVGGG